MSEDRNEEPRIDPDAGAPEGAESADLYHEFEFVSEDELTLRTSDEVEQEEEPTVLDLYGDSAPPSREEILEAAQAKSEAPEAAVHHTINRPAEGARQVLPGEVLSQDFQGAEGAADFLGLDLEFTEAQPELELAQAPGSAGTDGAEAQAGELAPGALMEPGDEGAFFEGEDDFELDPEAAPEFEEGLFEEDERPPRRGPQLALGALVGAAVVAGAMLAPRFLGGEEPAPSSTPATPTRVAKAPTPAAGAQPSPDAAPAGPAAGVPGSQPTAVAGVAPAPVPESPSTTGDPEAAAPEVTPDTAPEVASAEPETTPESGARPDPLGLLTQAVPVPAPSTPVAPEGTPGDAPRSSAFPNFDEGFAWVQPDTLDMVWRGKDVPMEAIFAPAKTLMPHVGPVRVHMRSGDTMEGKLYAVGEERVWIDMAPGRVGLDGHEVVRFEHLSGPVAASTSFLTGTTPASRERVRVRAPGGTFYGRVIAQEGSTVTLLQDGGGRIVLRDAVVEPAVQSRAIVVQR